MKSSSISFKTVLGMALSAIVALTFVTNASAQSSTTYNGGYQQRSEVAKAVVLAVRDVELNTQTGGGKSEIIGQLLGGAVGSLIGQKSNNYAVTGVVGTLGSVIGGQIGNSIGNSLRSQEIVVLFDDGRIFAITQASTDGVRFDAGQRVMVIGQGRVAPLL